MKTSKLLITSLLAAAAMSVPAFGANADMGNKTFSSTETVSLNNSSVANGENYVYGSVTVDASYTGTFTFGQTNRDLSISTLTLNGNLMITEKTCDLAEIGNISGTGNLTLSKNAGDSWGGALVLSGDSTGYTGTINIWNGASALPQRSGGFGQLLVLKTANAAGSATVALGRYTALYVSTSGDSSSTSIGGLNSSHAGSAVVSKGVEYGAALGDSGNVYNSNLTTAPTNDGTHRTLNISGSGTQYEFKGTFGSATNSDKLSLSMSGSGMQTLSGTNYINNLAVSGGKLVLSGTSTVAGTTSVSGGELSLSGTNTFLGSVSVTSGSLSLAGAINLSSAITVADSVNVTVADSVLFDLSALTGTTSGSTTTFSLISGKTLGTDWTNLRIDNIDLVSANVGTRGASVSFSDNGSVAITAERADLIWNGTSENSTWNTTTTNTNWKNGSSDDSFYTRDNVTFKSLGNVVTTVTLENGADITVGDMTVESGNYTLNAGAGNSATISGATLTVASGASLQLSSQLSGDQASALRLGFDNISVAGTLKVYTNSTDTWSKLTFAESGSGILHLYDIGGDSSTAGLTISTLQMSGNGAFTGTYDGKVDVGVLTGSGNLTLNSPTDSLYNDFTLAVGDMTSYTGAVSLVKGEHGTLTLSVDSTKIGSDARVDVGEGTTLKMNILEAENTSNDYRKISGTGTLSLGLRNDNGVGFNLSNFEGTIRVERGTGVTAASRFQLNTSTLNANARIVVAAGNDLVFHGTGTNISNAVTFEGSSSVYVNQNKTGELSGSVTAASGTLTKAGAGALTLSGTSTIGTLAVSVGKLNINGETTISEKLSASAGGTVNIGKDDGSAMTVTAKKFFTNDSNAAGTNTVNIKAGATLNITGSANAADSRQSSILIGHWEGTSNVNVAGTLSAANAVVNVSWTSGKTATLTVKDGGKVSALGIGQAQSGSGTANFVMEDGGTLELGASGITKNMTQFKLGAGTFRLTDNWRAATTQAMTLSSSAGTTFDTNGFSATLSGVISDATNATGALKKAGAGTLTLTNANLYSGGTTIEGGVLVAGHASALGGGNVTVADGAMLNLGTSAVTVAGLSGEGTVGLANGTTSSTLTVNSATDSTFSGAIGNAVSLVKQGTGTLELSGMNFLYSVTENAYQDVSVNAGTLRIVTNTYAMTSAGATTVASDAALEVSVSDRVSVSLTSVSISEGGKLIIDLSNYASETETFALDIITASALSYNGVDFAADCTSLIGSAVELKGWTQTGWTESLAYDGSTLSLTMTIPEPSVFGLLAGLGALALAGTRRRRRKA